MNRLILAAAVLLSSFGIRHSSLAAEPLRVFIRSGPKSHGPGAHDHPSFLRDWVPLLNERGAKASGGDDFPTKEQLAQTDVLLIHRDGGGNFKPEEKVLIDDYTKRGGGIVVIHAASVSDTPEGTEYYKNLIGGSWKRPDTKWLEGPMNLYFTDRENPITKDMSNFEMDDEMYYDMDTLPSIHVLAAAYTPKPQGVRNEKAMKKAAELTAGGKKVSVYDIQPQVWTHEKENYRAFVCIPGHNYVNFSHPTMRALILRGIAWAGKHANADELLKPNELGDNLRYVEGGPTRPEKAAEKLEVHPEFNISLVASEPLVNKVMNVDWDEKGRMWVCETPEYPNGRRTQNTDPWKDAGSLYPGKFEREPQDSISWLEDTNGDGVMDKKHVFADKLELVTSFCFYKNGVIACSAPDIWYLEDTTGKGVCDKRTKLYTGLGTGDTHAVINNLRWGLDGWVYATHGYSAGHVTSADGSKDFGTDGSGVVRFKPDGSAFEQYSSRGGNTWGLCMTWDGQCFWTQPTSGTVFFHTVLPESVLAKGKIPGTTSWKGMISGQKTYPLMKWEQQAYVQIDQVGAYTAAAGCAIYEGGAWPEKWNYSYFTGEPTINIVSHYFVKPDGVSYSVEKEKGREETEFVRSRDMWFRPIEERVGPDGALYIVDFYNQAVIHNDTRGPQHGPANAAVRPDRDHYFSRIWRLQHKEAKKLEVPVLDRKDIEGLRKIMADHPNAHVKQNAFRLLAEQDKFYKTMTSSVSANPLSLYHMAERADGAERQEQILNLFTNSDDPWSRSAIVAGASDNPGPFIAASLRFKTPDTLIPLVSGLIPASFQKEPTVNTIKLLTACAAAPSSADGLKKIILDGIAQQSGLTLTIDASVAESLKKLLANPATAGAALPLVAKWDTKGVLANEVKTQLTGLNAKVADNSAPIETRINAAKALIAVGGEAQKFVVSALAGKDTPEALQGAIIQSLGESGNVSELVTAFGDLKPALQAKAFDEILKRPEATLALLGAIKDGKFKPADLGPANVSRLRSHPNKQVAKAAASLMDTLSPQTKEKNALIAKLIPDVEKQGDPAKGKVVFAGCAVCHQLNGEGRLVGPPLTGMGAHGPAELIVHIVDPNREVDPSFWAWNITKKNGEVQSGVIAAENNASITLRTISAELEIKKDDIATRENTRRSLMPEGFEALGPEALRDLLAYICGSETRYRIVDLKNAYTADTRRGLFASEEATGDSVHFAKFGNITAESVPYFIMDPVKSVTGANVIVLKGGGGKNAAQQFPQRVEIPMNSAAKRLHLLSGIAGWGYPATNDERPAMKVTLTHSDGQSEVTELKNGQAFGDYNRVVDVPGSDLVEGLVTRGQLRRITLAVKIASPITKIILESFDNGVTPVVCAITADLAGAGPEPTSQGVGSPPAPQKATKTADAATGENAPKEGGKGDSPLVPAAPITWESGKTKVLVIGGGSSHNFIKFFGGTDVATLKEAGFSVNYVEDRDLVASELKNADVAVISANRKFLDTPAYRKAVMNFADAGKGLVMLHPGTWYGFPQWPELNAKIVGGGARGHDKLGPFDVNVLKKDNPIMKGVPATFKVEDELYYVNAEPDKTPEGTSPIEVLAETSPSVKYSKPHPSVWITKHDKAKIVGIALGHDERVHDLTAFKAILANAVKWCGGK